MFSTWPDPVRRALCTFAQTFVGLFLISVAGWLATVVTWAQCTTACTAFPDLTPLGKAAVAAFGAAAVAAVSFVQNYLEDHTSVPTVLKDKPRNVIRR